MDKRIEKIAFSVTELWSDRVFHITPDDIRVVCRGYPMSTGSDSRLHTSMIQAGLGRTLGYLTRGRREISICALPPRMSLIRYWDKGHTPEELAIRRFSIV